MEPARPARKATTRHDRPRYDRYDRYEPSRASRYAPYYSVRSPRLYSDDAAPARSSTRSETAVSTRSSKTGKAADKAVPVVPAGALHVIVSIDQQRASLYANGAFVSSTKVSTGTKSHPTPMGVFSVIQKNRHHISNLYGAPMPYMQRLTWSGTALHTGPLPGYPASHGCIRLSDEFAQMLWKATRIGARVIVTRSDVKPVDFAHARLDFPKPAPSEGPMVMDPAVKSTAVRAADATGAIAGLTQASATTVDALDAMSRSVSIAVSPPQTVERKGPVSIFISRKDGRIYVRQAMQPLLDMPLTVANPAQPIGTHVYTAMEMKDGAMRWTAVSIPSAFAAKPATPSSDTGKKKSRVETTGRAAPDHGSVPDASAALDRIELPQSVLERIGGLVTPGSSLIVSDNALSGETGQSTDFIVLTREMTDAPKPRSSR